MFLGKSFLLGRAVAELLEVGVRSELGVPLSSQAPQARSNPHNRCMCVHARARACVGACEYARSNPHNRWYACVRVRECACWGGVVRRRKEVMVLVRV